MRRRQRILAQEVLMFQSVMEGIRSGMKMESLFRIFIRGLCRSMNFKRCGIFLLDQDEKHIRLALGIDSRGRFEKNTDLFPVSHRRGLNDHSDLIYGYKKYFLTNNVPARIKEGLVDGSTVYNLAVVPIQIARKRTIGTLAVDNLNVHRPIRQEDVAVLINFATQLGMAIESLKAHEQIVNLSMTDVLTGLKNRRYFEQALNQEIQRCHRYKRLFSVILADVDHLKHFNDAYGHDAGDEVLKHVGLLLRSNLRNLDLVARFGGDEFAVLLPETPPHNIKAVTKRLLKNIRQSVPPILKMDDSKPKLTISLGIAGFRKANTSVAQIIKLADKSLYHAKNAGRNRCGPLYTATKMS
jgi:diguanylate cyclase (GGDEF)-like protein